MKVSAIQFKPKLFEKESNIEKIISYVKNVDSDLLVFPELCTTGYFFLSKDELKKVAEPFDGETIKIVQKLSTQLNKIIVFGFPEVADNKFYNSAAILFPEKKYSKVYRKTHLFYKEKFVFETGNTGFFNIYYPEFDLNLGTMICYDWRFPEAARTLALNGADLIVIPSNLVTKIWNRSMPARALDNHVYLLVANRIGTEKRNEESLEFNGKSAIYDYNGTELCVASTKDEIIITTDINPAESRNKDINQINNIFKDRLTSFYNLS